MLIDKLGPSIFLSNIIFISLLQVTHLMIGTRAKRGWGTRESQKVWLSRIINKCANAWSWNVHKMVRYTGILSVPPCFRWNYKIIKTKLRNARIRWELGDNEDRAAGERVGSSTTRRLNVWDISPTPKNFNCLEIFSIEFSLITDFHHINFIFIQLTAQKKSFFLNEYSLTKRVAIQTY